MLSNKNSNIVPESSSLAASLYPNLFHSLVLIDAVIHEPQNLDDMKYRTFLFIQRALSRRDTWSSRQVDTHIISSFFKKKNIYKGKKLSIHSSKILSFKPGIQPFLRSTSNVVST